MPFPPPNDHFKALKEDQLDSITEVMKILCGKKPKW